VTNDEIRVAVAASPALMAVAAARADGWTQAIADALSAGRTRLVPTEVGNGTVLEVLGFDVGNALLDLLAAQPAYRHVRPLLDQGRLRLDSAIVLGAMQQLVGQQIAEGVTFTQAHHDALRARASAPAAVPEWDVRCALLADDGSLRI